MILRNKVKILSTLIILLLVVVLVSCDMSDIEPPIVIPNPIVEIKASGPLAQQYVEEDSELLPVTFSLNFLNFAENEIDITNKEITWYEGYLPHGSGDTHRFQPQLPGKVVFSATVLIEGVLYETKELTVDIRTADIRINITNNNESNERDLELALGDENLSIEFSAQLQGVGIESVSELLWVVTMFDENNSENDKYEVTNEVVNGRSTLDYRFDLFGTYRVEARFKSFSSNQYYINVSYGDFKIFHSEESLVRLIERTDEGAAELNNILLDDSYTDINLEVPTLSIDGVYQWYLNDELIEGANTTKLVHSTHLIGQYRYHVEFTPNDLDAAAQVSDPLLVVYGIGVNNETELLAEITNKTTAIVLLDNIRYQNLNAALLIDYPVVISGDGFELSSYGNNTFIQIRSDNVSFHNIKLTNAERYTTHLLDVKNVYFENVIFINPGSGALTDPGAGIYAENSEVIVNNIEIVNGANSGVRIEGTEAMPAKVIVLGEFKYNIAELGFPIISIRSNSITANVVGSGFDTFVLPLSNNLFIRRWSRDTKPISWNLGNPIKTTYNIGEELDLSGIAISVAWLDTNMAFGLQFVKMFLDMFEQHGTVQITTLDDEVLKTYYVVGEDKDDLPTDPNFDEGHYDNLIYHDKPIDGTQVDMILDDLVAGQYKVKVDIGGELYLGFFVINIVAPLVP